jgi:hypothetical protein
VLRRAVCSYLDMSDFMRTDTARYTYAQGHPSGLAWGNNRVRLQGWRPLLRAATKLTVQGAAGEMMYQFQTPWVSIKTSSLSISGSDGWESQGRQWRPVEHDVGVFEASVNTVAGGTQPGR